MIASVDGYAQAAIHLNSKDLETLIKKHRLSGKIYRIGMQQYLPLRLYINEKLLGGGFPKDFPYEKKKYYRINIPSEGLERLKKGKPIGINTIGTISLRSLYIEYDKTA